jgi:AraC family transcriptional regulator, arabinose operon regulatory protein
MHKIAKGVRVVISISGNALDYWIEQGVENKDSLLTVNCCGYQKMNTRNLMRTRDQGRLDYQLIYVVGGKGIFHFEDEVVEVNNGQIVLYEPHQPQKYSYFAKDFTEVYWIHFSGYAAWEYLHQFGLLNQTVQSIGMTNEVLALFKKIIQELNMNKPLSDQLTAAYMLALLALVGRRLQADDPRKADPHSDINQIIDIMHEKYSQDFNVADLAKLCSLSTFRFIHKFKAVTGTTPIQYLTGIRINEAKRLLSETSLNVKEVAAIVGYENPLYFSRVFSNAVGIPPSRYGA